MTHLVYLTDLLAPRFPDAQELERMETESLVSGLIKVGIMPEQFPLLTDSILRSMFDNYSE